MTRFASPFWPIDWWTSWWDAWGSAPYIAPLRDSAQAPTLARLHATAFARPWDAHEFERMLCERGHEAHAVWRNGAVLGYALSRRVVDEAEILTVVLAPAARGTGLGHRLLRDHLAALTLAGVRRVHLEVDEGNEPALRLYARHGFAKVGERQGYYPLPDGSRATAFTMSATLS